MKKQKKQKNKQQKLARAEKRASRVNYIRIELLSDTCFSSGEIYNSMVDQDVCHDALGLPVIRGKRIKGCLREAAGELKDWGAEIDVEGIFGSRRDGTSALFISDAKPEKYDRYLAELSETADPMLTSPGRVLSAFTCVRTQTAVDEDGIAKESSLRSVRVLKKGMVFFAPVEFRCSGAKKRLYMEQMGLICKALRHMGLNRTRGMGSVKVSFETAASELFAGGVPDIAEAEYDPGKEYRRLDYMIYLHAPVLCKSVAGGQTVSCPYIEGAKILGMIAEACREEPEGNDGFLALTADSSLICSNAYISDGLLRFEPSDGSLFTVKDHPDQGRCRAVEPGMTENIGIEKLTPLDGKYIHYDGYKASVKNVDMEIRYHHSRPEDKSIGHVTSADPENQMYQIESICAGQMFAGYVLGTPRQIRQIYELFHRKTRYRIGYNRSAEYGDVSVRITGLSEEPVKGGAGECADTAPDAALPAGRFLLRLVSPVILRRKNGMAAPDERVLLDQLTEKLRSALAEENEPGNGNADLTLSVEKRFLKFTEIGGYNVTWHARKPTLPVFDKGTAFLIKSSRPLCLSMINRIWLGERTMEGYGELRAVPVPEQYCFEIAAVRGIPSAPSRPDNGSSDMMIYLNRSYAEETVRASALACAEKIWPSLSYRGNINTVVNQLALMLKESGSYPAFHSAMEARYNRRLDSKQEKLLTAREICIFSAARIREILPPSLPIQVEDEEIFRWYFDALLTQLKYKVRHLRRSTNGKEADEDER